MTTKERLHQIIDSLSEENAAEVLDYIGWLLEAPETLSPEEIERVRKGEDQIARGEYVTLDQLRRELDL